MGRRIEVFFKANTRAKQLDKHEQILRKNGCLDKHEPFIKEYTKAYIIMRGGAEVVGYFALDTLNNGSVCFWGFYIYPKYRGKGYGTYILLRVLRTLYEMNVAQVFCYFNKDNAIATHLYLKYGYLLGADERLYDGFESCSYPRVDPLCGYIAVFMQKVWGNSEYLMKGALFDVFNPSEI